MTIPLVEFPPHADAQRLAHGYCDDFEIFDSREEAGFLNIPMGAWAEQDGTALADFADGTSNTPGWSAGDEGFGIRWNNASAPDPISASVPVPVDLDSTRDVVVHVLAAKTGATVGDAVTWLIEAFFNVDAALYDADTDCGGTSSAMTGDATAKTCQEETLTIAAANVQGSPATLCLTLQPTDGTLGTDDVIVLGVWLEYTALAPASCKWRTLGDPGGSATVSDGAGGALAIVTDGDDNDEFYVYSTTESFLIAEGKPIVWEADVKFAQANTDDGNIIAGLMEAVAANALLDDGAGPAADYSGAVFFSVDGDTTWRVEYSDGTTQTTKELDADGSLDGVAKTSASTTYTTLSIEINPKSSTKVDVVFKIDDVIVFKAFDKTYASASEMAIVFGAKAGGANAETLYVDRVACYQKR